MVPSETIWFELIKLALQLIGALFISWMTVRWALGRFKSEKLWERQTAALADVLQAITELDRINTIRYDAAMSHNTLGDEYNQTLHQRRTAALRQFEKVAATASIVLPKSISLTIAQIESELDQFELEEFQDLFSFVTTEADLLRTARANIIGAASSLK